MNLFTTHRSPHRMLLLICALGALSTSAQSSNLESTPETEAPAASTSYQLSKFDTVSVTVFQQPELSASHRISETGTIALPLIGDIRVEGMTTRQAQATIIKKFIEEEYLVAPRVTVSVDQFSTKTITVLGEVTKPGQVRLPDSVQRINIQELLAMVGDFADVAKKDAVRIERLRPGSEEREIFIVDVESILMDKKADTENQTFYLRAGDIVFVPRRVF